MTTVDVSIGLIDARHSDGDRWVGGGRRLGSPRGWEGANDRAVLADGDASRVAGRGELSVLTSSSSASRAASRRSLSSALRPCVGSPIEESSAFSCFTVNAIEATV